MQDFKTLMKTGKLDGDGEEGDIYLIQELAAGLRKERFRNEAIAAADPLGADDAMLRLPALNAGKDVERIKEALGVAVQRAQCLPEADFVDCSAAIRDISIFGGSLVRLGIEPADCVPDFSQALLRLSADVDAQIPRDSFIDYTARNPGGTRERRFTSLPQEGIFIDSLRRGMIALDTCLDDIMSGYAYPFASRECAEHYSSAAESFQMMIDSIVQVKREITPEIFTHHIRPFFEPFNVGGRAYSAPSGAEMSVLNIDQIIWGADCEDEVYVTYFRANMPRLPVIYSQISEAFAGQKPLVTLLKDRLRSGCALGPDERRTVQMLHHFLNRVYAFRMAHYRVAEANVTLRLQESGGDNEVKGSSGFGLLETKYVLDQIIRCRQITSQALSLEG